MRNVSRLGMISMLCVKSLSEGRVWLRRVRGRREGEAMYPLELWSLRERTFKKFSFRGVDLDALLDMSTDELVKLFTARARRRFQRGLKRKPMALIKKLRKAVINEAPAGEKPELVKTHLRNMIIVPELIGSVVGVYNGKTFNQIEIKPEMIGHYLAEFSISYKPVKHGRPGIGATHSSRFIPLK
ncbi:small ribosomal subunit protein uS19y-like [Bidens hawaiensis]|uniref:small ribosomal subunit protein uS19y-like n=1 Tax=Bidens hawaiensis TaxID=980011 RepID=UPI00404A2AB0